MSIAQIDSHQAEIRKIFHDLINAASFSFGEMKSSVIPKKPGVYVITAKIEDREIAYYVGRTMNLNRRISKDHIHGNRAGARLKKQLTDSMECANFREAKNFLREFCSARWIEQEDFRMRGAIEGYATAILFPKYGITIEH